MPRSPIIAVVAIFADSGALVGQIVLRRDGSVATLGDSSACVDCFALLIRAAPTIDATVQT